MPPFIVLKIYTLISKKLIYFYAKMCYNMKTRKVYYGDINEKNKNITINSFMYSCLFYI